ncbi:hypothetical protein PO124_24015 [Bacillus licheniformis]|nr:hypothetical protein [Bacillus licheniformis]
MVDAKRRILLDGTKQLAAAAQNRIVKEKSNGTTINSDNALCETANGKARAEGGKLTKSQNGFRKRRYKR